jgi:lipoate-protein ligase A
MSTGLFLADEPRTGVDNMAIDQAMLEQTAIDGITRIRFYHWSEPTVSLGYFQRYGDLGSCPSLQGLAVVRRPTGGGAIVHHHDWTYSISLAGDRSISGKTIGAAEGLYNCVHEVVVRWLQEFGLNAQQWASKVQCDQRPASCSFLCFERRQSGDVVVDGHKVLGSAQRRLGTAVLQHGSLLLARSPHAPSLIGLHELLITVDDDNLTSLIQSLLVVIQQKYSVEITQAKPSETWVKICPETHARLASEKWIRRI